MQWIDIVQTIGIIISIVLVVWQVRIQTNQMKSTVNSLLTTKLDEINRLMFDNPELLPELDKSYPDQGGEGDRRHYLLFIIFNTFKQVFLQHSKYGFIDQNDWVPWVRTMTGILKKPYVEGHWQATKYHYAKDFQKYVDDLFYEKDNKDTKQMKYLDWLELKENLQQKLKLIE